MNSFKQMMFTVAKAMPEELALRELREALEVYEEALLVSEDSQDALDGLLFICLVFTIKHGTAQLSMEEIMNRQNDLELGKSIVKRMQGDTQSPTNDN